MFAAVKDVAGKPAQRQVCSPQEHQPQAGNDDYDTERHQQFAHVGHKSQFTAGTVSAIRFTKELPQIVIGDENSWWHKNTRMGL